LACLFGIAFRRYLYIHPLITQLFR
jgi:hypothetical protein